MPFKVRHFFLTLREIFILSLDASSGGTAGAQLQSVLSSPAVTAALQLPVEIATSVLQTQIDNALRVSILV